MWPPKAWRVVAPGLDDLGQHLVSQMLVYRPAARISSSDAIAHPFLITLTWEGPEQDEDEDVSDLTTMDGGRDSSSSSLPSPPPLTAGPSSSTHVHKVCGIRPRQEEISSQSEPGPGGPAPEGSAEVTRGPKARGKPRKRGRR